MTTLIPGTKESDKPRVDIAFGQVKGGRVTLWAVRCSECGWLRGNYPNKDKAAYMAQVHRDSH